MRDLASEIEWSKVSLLTPESYAAAATARRREPPAGLDATAMARLVAAYEEVKTERGVIDFEDVLLLMVGILREHDEVARAVRSQYRHFVVDEYQDVNRLQQTLLDLWLGERRDICVVGDPAQTIYSFTGASPEHLLGFRTRHPEARTVELVRNYRSSPAGGRPGQPRAPGPGRAASLRVGRAAGATAEGPAPELLVADNDPDEAATVATRIEALSPRATRPRRSRCSSAPTARARASSRRWPSAASPTSCAAASGSSPAARSATPSSSCAGPPAPTTARCRCPTSCATCSSAPAGPARHPTSGGAARERWESLAALAALADDLHASEPEARLPVLVRELDERASAQHAPTVQGVTLASLHAAKGLEWDSVFLVGLLRRPAADLDGRHPRGRRGGAPAPLRRRHPGPRAPRALVLPGAHPGGQGHPSPVALPRRHRVGPRRGRPQPAQAASWGSGRRGRGPAPVRSTCRTCGADLGTARERTIGRCSTCPATMDEQLFEALREWRLATAREADVPAFVVFTDATLTAIAERVPTDTRGLAGITGVGPAKLERYGDAVLAVLQNFSDEQSP